MAEKKDLLHTWSRILAHAWADEQFKESLLKNPDEVLKKNGFPVDANHHYKILEDTDNRKNIVIHSEPDHFEYIHSEMANAWKSLAREIKTNKKTKEKLLSQPYETMQKYGIAVSSEKSYHIVEETPDNKYLVLIQPSGSQLSEVNLKRLTGGSSATDGFCTDSSS